jgi:hypothetical protein
VTAASAGRKAQRAVPGAVFCGHQVRGVMCPVSSNNCNYLVVHIAFT